MKKVVVGISGGVDSAVAAYLLKKQGYDVVGVFMRNWDSTTNNDILGNPTLDNSICPQEEDYNDALQICEQLGIELKRVDFVEEYWQHVFTYFIEEYKKARTPNPDILCNKHIKFKAFLDYALSLGADYVATGHYAQVEHFNDHSIMKKGFDQNKDQTYFLCQLEQWQLQKTLFPLGLIPKSEVRKIASELDLVVASKKDSTGICFIGERDFKQFLQNYVPAKSGKIVDIETKTVVGDHSGIMYYTIGQSKGLGIGGLKQFKNAKWFVVGKDIEQNILYVAQDSESKWLLSQRCEVIGFNWINKPTALEFSCQAKFRYRQKDNDVQVRIIDESTIEVLYPQGILAVTPGQECVLYDGDICLGGGEINRVYQNDQELAYL